MPTSRPHASEAAPRAAMLAAVAMIAHQVGGKATRDALFLSTFHVSRLPAVMVASALLTIVVILGAARALHRLGPGRLVPWAYLTSAALHLGEWALLTPQTRQVAAVALYLHVSIVPVLISGFWSILSEGMDPRANRRQMTRAALAASIGGVLGGTMVWFRDISLLLPLLALLDLFCAGAMFSLQGERTDERAPWEGASGEGSFSRALFGRDLLSAAPYLVHLAGAVTLFAASAALLEYFFKAQAQAAFPAQADLRRMFSLFYTSTALGALIVQISLSRLALKKVGLVPTAASLPLSVTLGSAIALTAPGLLTAAIVRGSEVVTRNSLFRSAYEPLYTAVPASHKNASKAIVDVGFERVGDALGATTALALLPMGVGAARAQLLFAMGLSIAGLLLSRLIDRGYKHALRRNVERGAVKLVRNQLYDSTTVRIASEALENLQHEASPTQDERVVQEITALRSGDLARIHQVLAKDAPITPLQVAHVIPLLGRDDVAELAIEALRRVAVENAGQLIDRLLDPSTGLAARRRIPRVLEACDSGRAVEGLLSGLGDLPFEIRFRCGRALARRADRGLGLHMDKERVLSLVLREVEVERQVWEARQLLEIPRDETDSVLVDEKLRRRANRSLEHVFNLLTLALPREPLLLAFRALHTEDRFLRGTALDYLETALPRPIREKLWPFLEVERRGKPEPRSREAVLEALLESHESIEISLTALQRMSESSDAPPP